MVGRDNILKKKSIFFTALLKSKYQEPCQPTICYL